MHYDTAELRAFVEANPKLVTRKQSKRYPNLYVLKYSKKVFYDNLWHLSPWLLECRGLVVDADYNVIIKPFTKVFNYGENGTTIDRDENCRIVRKVNGFLGVATWAPKISDKLIYSTTGSLDSDFVDLVEKHVGPLAHNIESLCSGRPTVESVTFMFEICDPTDPHIVPEEQGAYLIGCTVKHTDGRFVKIVEGSLDIIYKEIGAKRPEAIYAIRFSDVVKLANACKHEGYMVYGYNSGTALKIKSPFYLTQKLFARMGETKLEKVLDDPKQVKQRLDEEYYPLVDYITNNAEAFRSLDEQGRLKFMAEYLKGTNER